MALRLWGCTHYSFFCAMYACNFATTTYQDSIPTNVQINFLNKRSSPAVATDKNLSNL